MGLAERKARCGSLIERYYAGVPMREALMDRVVADLLTPTHRLLDAGCGDTLPLLERYGLRAAFAVGVDVVAPTRRLGGRTALAVGDLARLPFEDEVFDLIVSRSVVEHLEDPSRVFRELRRALRPGGKIVFTTPNRYYYSSVVAGAVPYRWKDVYMRGVFRHDGYAHFPVFYRANTARAIGRVAAEAGLTVERLDAVRHYPYYLMFSPVLFRLGVLYDRLVTRFRLDSLQSTWLVVMGRA